MESQEQKKKPQRKSRKGRGGNSQLQQQVLKEPHSTVPCEPRPGPSEHLRPGSERGDMQPRVRDDVQAREGRGLIQQTPRFRGLQAGNQPTTRWRTASGLQQFRGAIPRPPFSPSGQQQPLIRQQTPPFETQPLVTQPKEPHSTWCPKNAWSGAPGQHPEPGSAWSEKPQQCTEKTWNPKSVPGEITIQHPDPGSVRPKHQPAEIVQDARHARGDSQQLQARDDAQLNVSQETVRMPTKQQVGEKAPERPGFSKSPSKKSVYSEKKKGIGDKPLHESLEETLALGSSAEKFDTVKSITEETAPGQISVQEPPKRLGILKHSAQYFESERGHPIQVNYLRIDVKSMKFKIFQYAVEFSPRNPRILYRDALRLFFQQNGINRHPAFDGRALLFAGGSKLEFPNGLDAYYDTVRVTAGNESVEFYITMNYTRHLSLEDLFEFMKNGSSMNPYSTQPLDLALMNAPIISNLIKVGRSFYSRPAEPIPLGNGLDLWTGHYQGVIIPWLDETQKNHHLYLNVDVAHKGFISHALAVTQYVKQEFFGREAREAFKSDSRLVGWQLENAENFLKDLKIDYEVPNQRKRSFKVVSCGPPARNARFKPDNNQRETTVEEYFRMIKNRELQYPNLPCLRDSRGRMFPMEFCTITSQAVNKQLEPNQSRVMVDESARSTIERKRKIEQSIGNLNFANDPCMKEFGLTLNTTFETVNAYVLKPPTVQYQRKTVPVKNGKWDNDKFIKPIDLSKWVLLNTDSYNVKEFHTSQIVKDFQAVGPTCGVNVTIPMTIIKKPKQGRIFHENDFIEVFTEWKNKGFTFFMVIMNSRSDRIYSYIKRAAELAMYDVGVLTQCLKADTVLRQIKMKPIPSSKFFMTAKNILLKLNAKISGVNHSLAAALKPEILDGDVMIVGADVTHPSPGSKELSIAAVAASHDKYGFQYNMQYRLQKPKVEIIVELREMLTEQIEFFRKKTGQIPKRILYYRDGVGDGYFKKVLQAELTAIIQACASFKAQYRTMITFLLVQKRHHTRFFPTKQLSDGTYNQNVRPGTVVDEKITHPTEFDFFLVSHASLKGTARPTKYHLLYDDSSPAIDQETLERVTFCLCHLFARCNRSVSYPAPTYYAHCAAIRAKAWWNKQPYDENNLERDQQERGLIRDDVVRLNPMFFI